MPHQMGICVCGRRRHWPKHAKVGDEWRCRRCGRTTVLVEPGTPGGRNVRIVRSRKPKLGRRTAASQTRGRKRKGIHRAGPRHASPQDSGEPVEGLGVAAMVIAVIIATLGVIVILANL